MGDTIAQKLIRSHLVSGDMSVPGSFFLAVFLPFYLEYYPDGQ